MCIVLPTEIKKIKNKAANVNVITVNNFFYHWLKELDARRYPDDIRTLPINNTVEIYGYAAQQLKHLPKKSLDNIRETLLYEKKPVILNNGRDRRSNTSTTPADRTDANLGEIVTDSLTLYGKKIYYRIPLGFFISIGLVNFPHIFIQIRKQPKQIIRNKRKTWQYTKRTRPDTSIIFHKTPYTSYPQITLDDNFLAYLNAILRSHSVLRTRVIFITLAIKI